MGKSKTHFEQVPIRIVKKIATLVLTGATKTSRKNSKGKQNGSGKLVVAARAEIS